MTPCSESVSRFLRGYLSHALAWGRNSTAVLRMKTNFGIINLPLLHANGASTLMAEAEANGLVIFEAQVREKRLPDAAIITRLEGKLL